MDLVEEFAYPLPVIVICEMLGVPVEDHERFKHWGLDIARGLERSCAARLGGGQAEHAAAVLAEYFRELIAERRTAPAGRHALRADRGGGGGRPADEDELLATCILLLVAGHETTVNLIGNGTLALLRHPDQLRRLRETRR